MAVRRGPLSLARLAGARNGGSTTNTTRRTVHTVKKLPYDVSKGLGDFLPPDALKVVGHDYQKGLLDRLNDEVKESDMKNETIVQTIISASLDRTRVLAFNYASLALNNHFFLDNLKPPPSTTAPSSDDPASIPLDHSTQISRNLEMEIRHSHGSLAQLKSTFSAAALGMFTSGYVWFVTDNSGNTAVVPTFGSGSLLMRSQSYLGSVKNNLPASDPEFNGNDMQLDLGQWNRGNFVGPEDPYHGEWRDELERRQAEAEAEASSPAAQTNPTSRPAPPGTTPSSPASGTDTSSALGTSTPPHARSLHSTTSTHSDYDFTRLPASLTTDEPSLAQSQSPARQSRTLTRTEVLTLGETLYPLFCLSVHEHAWLSAGYGVWGKEEWIKKFWGVLDWGKVSAKYEVYAKLALEKHSGVNEE